MPEEKSIVYPYIPNSEPAVKDEMLKAVGAENIEDFFADIPDSIRLKDRLNLPDPLLSEYDLVQHVEGLLAKNPQNFCLFQRGKGFGGQISFSESTSNPHLRLDIQSAHHNQ